MTNQTAGAVLSLLLVLCERTERMSSDQLEASGSAARAVLAFAWQNPRNRRLVVGALRCVCRTFESDAGASRLLLKQALEKNHIDNYGFEEIPWLAREARRLILIDPDFVKVLYLSAFGHREKSEEQTELTDSRILSLRSNRKQDFNHALWQLAETYPIFLESYPVQATVVLIAAVESYVNESHTFRGASSSESQFMFGGREGRIEADFSSSWMPSEAYRFDEPVRMLMAFQAYITTLVAKPNSIVKLDQILEVITQNNCLAALWRCLLMLGAQHPDIVGIKLKTLLKATPILLCRDTTTEAGELLRVMFTRMSAEERRSVEQAILSLSDKLPSDQRRYSEYVRDRLAGCLEPRFVVSKEMDVLVKGLHSSGDVPANEPLVRWSGMIGKAFGEDEYLSAEGVPVGDETSKHIRDLEKPVKQFADTFRNKIPSQDEIVTSFPALSDLWTALGDDKVHPKQHEYALDTLAEACASIAGSDQWLCESEEANLVRRVLLTASVNANPAYDQKRDEQFDNGPSWGRPAPRIVAADGLTRLGRHSACTTEEVLNAIENLSADPVPAVRFQVVGRILSLYQTAPDLMWRIIERVSRDEESTSVLQQLVGSVLGPLSGSHIDRVVSITRQVMSRFGSDTRSEHLRTSCLSLFAQLYVWRNQEISKEITFSIARGAGTATDDAWSIVGWLRDLLSHGPVEPTDPVQDAVRNRAIGLVEEIVRAATTAVGDILAQNQTQAFENWLTGEKEQMLEVGGLLDHIGMEFYFASGAYDSQRRSDERKVSAEARARFYRETSTILDLLSSAGFPSVVHHLLETLEIFIAVDPKGVLLRIGSALRAGKAYGYQYEPQGAQLFVKLIEQYLAEHRELFQEDSDCRQVLRESLDLFVNWPQARQLVYRLEEIFR